jgi:hypothetical protein
LPINSAKTTLNCSKSEVYLGHNTCFDSDHWYRVDWLNKQKSDINLIYKQTVKAKMCQNEYFNWLLIFEVLYTFKLESICRVVSLFTLIHHWYRVDWLNKQKSLPNAIFYTTIDWLAVNYKAINIR